MYSKKANFFDVLFLYHLVNEESVRKASFDSSKISLVQHFIWFIESYFAKERKMFILIDKNEKIGQFRLDIERGEITVDYSVSGKYQGKGYGKAAVGMLLEYCKYSKEFEGNRIIAKVKTENIPSRKCFEKNGFIEEIGHKVCKFIYEL